MLKYFRTLFGKTFSLAMNSSLTSSAPELFLKSVDFLSIRVNWVRKLECVEVLRKSNTLQIQITHFYTV